MYAFCFEFRSKNSQPITLTVGLAANKSAENAETIIDTCLLAGNAETRYLSSTIGPDHRRRSREGTGGYRPTFLKRGGLKFCFIENR